MKPRSHDVTMQTACPVVDSPDLPPSPRDSSAWIRHPGLATPVMAANSSTGAKRVIVGHSRWNRFLRCYWPEGNTADVTKDDARDQPYQAMEMEPLQIRPRPPRQHRIHRFTSHTRPTLPCSWPLELASQQQTCPQLGPRRSARACRLLPVFSASRTDRLPPRRAAQRRQGEPGPCQACLAGAQRPRV